MKEPAVRVSEIRCPDRSYMRNPVAAHRVRAEQQRVTPDRLRGVAFSGVSFDEYGLLTVDS